MGYFSNAAQVDKYIGGMFRHAADHPEVGPKMKAADIVLKVIYVYPACELTVVFRDPMLVAMDDAGPSKPTTPRTRARGRRAVTGRVRGPGPGSRPGAERARWACCAGRRG